VGDLSGKHGTIPAGQSTFETSYVDLYASTNEGLGSFFGNRSIVIHHSVNSSRITCANFELTTLPGDGDDGEGEDGGEDDGEDDGASPCSVCQQPSATPSFVPSGIETTTTPAPSTTTQAPGSQTSVVTAGAAGLRAGIVGAGAAVVGAAALFML